MSGSFFYLAFDPAQASSHLVKALKKYSGINKIQVYVINSPLGDVKYDYGMDTVLVVLVPNHKIMILNIDASKEEFEDFCEDFIEDLGSISDKYNYKGIIGRVRKWRNNLIHILENKSKNKSLTISDLLRNSELESPTDKKHGELLISLLTGSINDIERVKQGVPDNILDKIKQKIVLFDGDQTRFVYSKSDKDVIKIQGLSGTGKTELLLHKLKEIYTNKPSSKTMFTCHNKILASNLRDRIPDFFNFMKVEEQIKWNERLWCRHAWGSQRDPHSGAYRYICHKYNIPFHTFSYNTSFASLCKSTNKLITEELINENGHAFDYMLVDESQDFPREFIDLCTKVTKNTVYVAGDIFQSIFDDNVVNEVTPDYLLSKCYRTDPRTLMFAHGVGMGLFEDEKLRWLDDKEWEQCGYIVDNEINGNVVLKREPLKRFEDLKLEDISSVEIIRTNNSSPSSSPDTKIIQILQNILEQNPTVNPDDIGIIYIGSNKKCYSLSDLLEYRISQEFNWPVNKAYDTKSKVQGSIFVSNKNHVKGLEFPFVICVVEYLSDFKHERNALYMTLTRSFIQSYLLIDETYRTERLLKIESGLNTILKSGAMMIVPPSEDEKPKISAKIKFDGVSQSIYELAYSVFDDLDAPPLCRDPIFRLISTMNPDDVNYETLYDLVETNLEKMKFTQ